MDKPTESHLMLKKQRDPDNTENGINGINGKKGSKTTIRAKWRSIGKNGVMVAEAH